MDSSSSEAFEAHESEEEYEQAEFLGVRTNAPKPGTRRPTYMPPPPPEQADPAGRRISLEPPQLLGRVPTDFTKVAKAAYLTFRHDVNQFTMAQDSMDPRFHTNAQADIFTTVIISKGLSLHHYIDLEHIRDNPAKYPGAIALIESSGLAQPFAFQQCCHPLVLCNLLFGPNKTVTWMTSDTELTATYAEFVAALGFVDVGFKIHKDDPNHKPKPIDACGYFAQELG